jgi:hypothetical protein
LPLDDTTYRSAVAYQIPRLDAAIAIDRQTRQLKPDDSDPEPIRRGSAATLNESTLIDFDIFRADLRDTAAAIHRTEFKAEQLRQTIGGSSKSSPASAILADQIDAAGLSLAPRSAWFVVPGRASGPQVNAAHPSGDSLVLRMFAAFSGIALGGLIVARRPSRELPKFPPAAILAVLAIIWWFWLSPPFLALLLLAAALLIVLHSRKSRVF